MRRFGSEFDRWSRSLAVDSQRQDGFENDQDQDRLVYSDLDMSDLVHDREDGSDRDDGSDDSTTAANLDREFAEKLPYISTCLRLDVEFLLQLQSISYGHGIQTIPFAYDHVSFATAPKTRVKMTKTLLSEIVWQAKHNISRCAIDDLLTICNSPWFNASHLRGERTLCRKRAQLPLLPLFHKKLKETDPSQIDADGNWDTSRTVEFPFHSVCDIINQELLLPNSMDDFVFEAKTGPICREQWHGRQFRESPLFTVASVVIRNITLSLGDTILCRNKSGHGNEVCLIAGISRNEATGKLVCFLRKYNFSTGTEKGKRKRTELTLTEVEEILNLSDIGLRFVERVEVEHEPSARPRTGLL